MTADQIHKLFEEHPDYSAFDFSGRCHDCGCAVNASIDLAHDGFAVTGGAIYWPAGERDENGPRFYLKCGQCHAREPQIFNWRPCEVYDRVVGYYRPIENMNDGKRAEVGARRRYRIDSI